MQGSVYSNLGPVNDTFAGECPVVMRCAIAVLFSLLAISDAQAQRVVGRLLDRETGIALTNVSLTLLGQDNKALGRVVSNATGHFEIAAPREGKYRLRAERIGYSPATTDELTIGAGQQVVVDLSLSVNAVQLQSVNVIARRPGELGGFYDRMGHSPAGTFVTGDQIEWLDPSRTTQILTHWGLRISYPRNGTGLPTIASGRGCMRVVVDGVRDPPNFPRDLDGIPPEFIDGIEIYKEPQQVPPQYMRGFDQCGAILIWTSYSR